MTESKEPAKTSNRMPGDTESKKTAGEDVTLPSPEAQKLEEQRKTDDVANLPEVDLAGDTVAVEPVGLGITIVDDATGKVLHTIGVGREAKVRSVGVSGMSGGSEYVLRPEDEAVKITLYSSANETFPYFAEYNEAQRDLTREKVEEIRERANKARVSRPKGK